MKRQAYLHSNNQRLGYVLLVFAFLTGILPAAMAQSPGTWTQKANFGGPGRIHAICFGLGNKGYLGLGNAMVDFWEYDPATNTWTQMANFPGGARNLGVGFSIATKGYVGTGAANVGGVLLKDFWEFDPVANAWTQKADVGGTGREMAIGFSTGGKGYIGTGFGVNPTGYLSDFWEYDPATNAWTQKASMAQARSYGIGFGIGGKGYVGIGYNGVSLSDFWEFDPPANTWTQKAAFAGGFRYWAAGFSIGGQGYIGTGYNNQIFQDFWEYNPGTNAWTQRANFGGGFRYVAAGFSIGGKGYLGTGSYGMGGVTDFWEYTPVTILTDTMGTTSFCKGDSIHIFFTVNGTFNAGNIFTAQLSDALGSFASPVNIGSITGTTSGVIHTVVPGTTPAGTGYRVRVISSNPALTGSNNGNNLTVSNSVVASVTISTPSDTVCAFHTVTLTAIGINGGSAPVYQWKTNGVNLGPNSPTLTYLPVTKDTVTCTLTSSLACAAPGTSNAIVLTVVAPPAPVIHLSGGNGMQTDPYTSYQWNYYGNPIPGATAQSYTATQNGAYTVTVTDTNGCSGTSSAVQFPWVGIGSVPVLNEVFNLYPNPARGEVSIALPGSMNDAAVVRVFLLDVTGKTIGILYEGHIAELRKSNTLTLPPVAEGLYMVKLEVDGMGTAVRKLSIR